MSKVREGGKPSDFVNQLPLYDDIELPDHVGNEDLAGRITPEEAHAILKEHGLDVSLEQAKAILCFLRRLASISLTQILKK